MIRRYAGNDEAQLLDVWNDAARLAYPFWGSEDFERERTNIAAEFLPVAETWVFEEAGRVVGFISLLGNEVGGLFVDPKRHGRGIGRALMDHARGTRTSLELDVFEANEIGRAFYDRYGFRVAERRVDDHTGMPVLRMVMGS